MAPFNAIGLFIGDSDADNAVGPPLPNGVIQAENKAFLQTENGSFLAFD
tara:strand:+ start:429 stop:575 length:147 start_codon:yes stop_codon:yes gene_type:complete